MPDIWMDVDAALAEVPVNVMPLIDDTDFKSIENAVVYNAAGMTLKWHFVTTAGVMTEIAVVPTTAGVHDWIDQGASGLYALEIPASAGTINNDTEGVGWFSGVATGVLPWRGPLVGFRAAGLNNLLIDNAFSTTRALAGTALPDAAADAAGGLAISDLGGVDLDTVAADAARLTAARAGILTDWINGGRLDLLLDAIPTTVMRGTDGANTVVPDSAGVAATQADVATEVAAGLTNIHLDHLLAANYDPTAKPGVATALLNELIESNAGVSRYTAGALAQAPSGTGGDATQAKQDSIIAAVITNAAGVDVAADIIANKAAIDAIPTTPMRGTDGANTTTPPTTATIATAVLTTQMTEAYAAKGVAPTLSQLLFLAQQLLGDFAIIGTTLSVKGLDGVTEKATYTLDDAINPTGAARAT